MAPPGSMRVSSGLLFGVGGVIVVRSAVELVFVNTGLSVYHDAYTGKTGSGFASIAGATVGILAAAAIWILAVLNLNGRHGARVATLVLGSLFLLCQGFGTSATDFHQPARSAGAGAVARVLPAAYGIGIGGLEALAVLATAAALVLLALPASNHFFQNRRLAAYAKVLMKHPNAYPAAPAPHGWPVPDQEPHTSSTPAIDPWAEPPRPAR